MNDDARDPAAEPDAQRVDPAATTNVPSEHPVQPQGAQGPTTAEPTGTELSHPGPVSVAQPVGVEPVGVEPVGVEPVGVEPDEVEPDEERVAAALSDGESSAAGPVADGPVVAPASRRSQGSFWKELPILVIIAFGLALLIKTFLVQAFFIPSGSMETTLHGCPGCTGDRVLVNKLVYDLRSPHRGEIVVFDGSNSWAKNPEFTVAPATTVPKRVARFVGSTLGLGAPNETDYIKRVVGVGGDTVACCTDGKVTVTPAGSSTPVVLQEPYIYQNNPLTGTPCSGREFGPITVPQGRLWVMGDHRGESSDSRCHLGDSHNGTVAVGDVVGKAFVVVFPLDRIKLLPTPDTFAVRGLTASQGPAGLVPTTDPTSGLVLAGLVPVVGRRRDRRP